MTDAELLVSLRKKRGAYKRKITEFSNYINQIRDHQLTRGQEIELEQRIEAILPVLEKIDEIQNEIFQLPNSDQSDEDYLPNIEGTYYKVLSEAKLLLEVTKGDQDDDGASHVTSRHSGSRSGAGGGSGSGVVHHVKLPTISLPKFDGQFSKWLEFHDIYVSLIHDNESLSNVQKFHYLKSALLGDAAEIIKSYPLTASNYITAWELLCERYTNKKLLVQNHLKELFNLNECNKESAAQLREMLDNTAKQLRSLEALGQPVEHWDSIIIYLLTSKFDKLTARDWELTTCAGDVPTLKELKGFLSKRADMLDNLNLRDPKVVKPIPNTSQRPEKPQRSYASSNLSCYYCKGSHAIYNCSTFLGLTPTERLTSVKNLKLCTNCLRNSHRVDKCDSRSKGCKKCQKNHNTLLHIEAVTNTPNESSQQANSTNQVALSSNLPKLSQVILATAVIDIEDIYGNKMRCRALLDSGSQSNFITRSFQTKLNLPISDSNISIQGINQIVSQINAECTVILHSRINHQLSHYGQDNRSFAQLSNR